MTSGGSVTHWIDQVKEGNEHAAQELWERYFQRLVFLARKKLANSPRRVADEEDAVVSAFDSFYRGANCGQFPQLHDRDDLWRLLVVITARKAVNQAHHQRRQKRGGGKVRGESVWAEIGADDPVRGMTQIAGQEPTPEFAAQVAEECRNLLERLDDPVLRQIALWKMEGYTNEEIAKKAACTKRTVARKMTLIRMKFEERSSDE